MCEDRNRGEEKRMRRTDTKILGKNIYVGQTASMYEKTKGHVRDGKKMADDSHIAKHWDECHHGEEMPMFRFMIVKRFQDSLSRQVSKSVRIDMREEVLNSKIEKTDWEKKD